MLNSDSIFGSKKEKTSPLQPAPMGSSGSSGRPFGSPAPMRNAASPQPAPEAGSQLIVGPNIKLKGVEINDCDTLVVEGRVEATMDSRVIRIAENGSFKGSVDIDVAEIRGEFNGDLTARERLVIHATGRVTGKIRYGRLVVEDGGQLSGDIQRNSVAAVSAAAPDAVAELKTA